MEVNPEILSPSPILTIVIPLYNEEKRIPFLERDLLDFLKRWEGEMNRRVEIFLVDDASRDQTSLLIRGLQKSLEEASSLVRVFPLSLEQNAMKGGALQQGILLSQGEFVLTMDADVATSSLEIFHWIEKGSFDWNQHRSIFLASREHHLSSVSDPSHRRVVGRIFNFLFQFLSGLSLSDTQCGFKLYPGPVARELFGSLKVKGWAHDIEIILKAREKGCSFLELPIAWTAIEGSKVRVLRDGFRMFFSLIFIKIIAMVFSFREIFREESRERRLVFLFFFSSFLLLVGFFRGCGMGGEGGEAGPDLLRYYTSFFRDIRILSFSTQSFSGGFFELLCQVVSLPSPLEVSETRRLIEVFFCMGALYYTYRIGFYLSSYRYGGLLSALVLAVVFLFFEIQSPLEIPFAALYAMSLYYLCLSVPHGGGRIPKGLLAKIALSWGFLMALHVGGMALFLGLGLMVGAHQIYLLVQKKVPNLYIWWNGLFPFLISYTLMVVFWPWAQQNPFTRPFGALTNFFSRGMDFSSARELSGEGLLLPLASSLVLWGILFLVILWGRGKGGEGKKLELSLVFLSLALPISLSVLGIPLFSRGLGHFFFVVPPGAILLGLAISLCSSGKRGFFFSKNLP